MNTIHKIQLYRLFLFVVVIISGCDSQKKNNTAEAIISNSVFSIPFNNIQIEKTTYIVDGQKDTVLFYKTGSKIILPQNAFVDKEGNTVKGKIELEYRELSSAFDAYIAGVPMLYDSAGVEQVFETAGMVEINAYSQQQPVYPNPQQKIQVQMNSFEDGKQYNVYQLDTITGKWQRTGTDRVIVDDYKKQLADLPKVPAPPCKASQYSFSIDDDTGEYPELNMYKNVLFEPVDNKSVGFGSTEIKVKDLANGIYHVVFIFDAYGVHREEGYDCYLAFKEGADYDNAMLTYQNKYKTLIEKRAKKKQQIDDEWKTYFDIKQKYTEAGLIDVFYKKEVTYLEGEQKITRVFEVNGFGFVNCDYPNSYPRGAELIASYKDKQGKPINISNVVLIEKGRNAIFRYTNKIKFNPAQENILFGITTNNELAYCKSTDFRLINQTNGDYTFAMNVCSEQPKTYEEVCNILFAEFK